MSDLDQKLETTYTSKIQLGEREIQSAVHNANMSKSVLENVTNFKETASWLHPASYHSAGHLVPVQPNEEN